MKRNTINALVFYLGLPLVVGLLSGTNRAGIGGELSWGVSVVFWVSLTLGGWWFFHACTIIASSILRPWSPPLTVKLAAGIVIASVPLTFLVNWYILQFEPFMTGGQLDRTLNEFAFSFAYAQAYLERWTSIFLLWISANLYFDRIAGLSLYRRRPAIPEDLVSEDYEAQRNALGSRNAEDPEHAAVKAPGPLVSVFLSRLPVSLGTNIRAMQSEDHYLRVHTERGDTLILFNLSDAIKEMQFLGIEGTQVHRSFWVANDAVTGSIVDGRKLVLSTDCGTDVPVSQTFKESVRQAGLLDKRQQAD